MRSTRRGGPARHHAAEGPPWTAILPKTALRGDARTTTSPWSDERAWTHVRLNIYPDGGVARLRVYGDVVVDWSTTPASRLVDLAFIRHGGIVLAVSDMHYGAKDNMLMPGRAKDMSDGWETRRRRGPGTTGRSSGWALPVPSARIEIDTNHFKGNYPDRASIDGCLLPGASLDDLTRASWDELLPQAKLQAHHRHIFRANCCADRPGVARAAEHLPGRRRQPAARAWNPGDGLTRAGRRGAADAGACCGAARWVERMLARRPFGSQGRLLHRAGRVVRA
jgi:allantoicase